jgi:carboxymethylenebutenolidase
MVGALGFCIGGRVAFLAAVHAKVDAAVALYAFGLANYAGEIAALSCPLQLHYGLKDPHIPVSEIDAVKQAAQENSKVELHLYADCGHGFFSPERPTYDPTAAATAARRIERFLQPLLGHQSG